MSIKVILVDDHAVMRMGLVSLLRTCDEIEVVGDAGNGATGIRLALKHRPDVIIADLMMPKMDGLEMTRQLLAQWPEANVLVLTTCGDAEELSTARSAGAKGILLKSSELSELRKAIATVARGKPYTSDEVDQIISSEEEIPQLTKRQQDVLNGIMQGLSNPEIARILGISLPVVKEHLTGLFQKLGVTNRTEAVALALRKHLQKI